MGKGQGKGEGKGEGKGGFLHLLEEIGNAIKCIMCMPFIGLILLIIGIVVLGSAANDTRSHDIKEWNTAKDEWTAKYREAFTLPSGVKWTAKAVSASQTKDLAQDTTDDPMDDEKKSGDPEWKTYKPLKYTTGTGLDFSTVTTNTRLSIVLEQSGGNGTKVTIDNVQAVKQTTMSLNCYTSRPSNGKCKTSRASSKYSKWCTCSDACYDQGSKAHWDGVNCRQYSIPSSLCMRLNENFQLDTRSLSTTDQGGCEYSGDNWEIGKYTSQTYNSGGQYTLNGLKLTVRSTKDPYIKAEDLTDGDLNFGLTTKEKLVLGASLSVIGGLLFGLPICGLCWFFKQRSNKNQGGGSRIGANSYAAQTNNYGQAPTMPQQAVTVPIQQQPMVQPVMQQQPVVVQQQPGGGAAMAYGQQQPVQVVQPQVVQPQVVQPQVVQPQVVQAPVVQGQPAAVQPAYGYTAPPQNNPYA